MADIPIPDVSQLPTSTPNPLAQMAGQGMNQVAPPPEPGGRLRSLLSNFFQGAGGAMMKQVGLPTPQEQQQQEFTNNLRTRQQNSLEDYHAIIGENAGLKLELQREKQLGPVITPEHAKIYPFLADSVGSRMSDVFGKMAQTKMTTDTSAENAQLGATSREKVAQNNARNKTPNEIALIQRMMAGDKDAAATLNQLQKNRVALAAARGQAFGASRPGAYLDNEGNVIADYAGHAISQGYTPAVQGAKAMSQQAQFGEIKTGMSALRTSIINLDKDFTPDQRAKLSLAMRSPDESVLHTIVNSMLGTEQLTPRQQDYIISSTQGLERILSLRTAGGFGSATDATRQAMQATLPNVNMADKAYGLKQMDALDQQIESLYQGVPKVKSFRGGGGSSAPAIRIRLADGRTGTIPATSLPKYQKMPGVTILGK